MSHKSSDSIWRSVVKDILRYVISEFGFILLALGIIWLLLSLHWVLAAQIVLVISIVIGFLLWLFASSNKS